MGMEKRAGALDSRTGTGAVMAEEKAGEPVRQEKKEAGVVITALPMPDGGHATDRHTSFLLSPVSSDDGEPSLQDRQTSSRGTDTEASATSAEETKVVKGGVIITDGRDVAEHVVSLQDDGDPALTFRAFVIGSVMTLLAASINQIYFFKPVEVGLSGVFLCLSAYALGRLWATALPRRHHVDRHLPSVASWLGPMVHFINPGKFNLKEHAITTTLSTTAGTSAAIVHVFGVEKLFYNREIETTTAILTVLSAATFGYGIVGVLRPICVHPSEMAWWSCLPMVSIYNTLHRDSEGTNAKRMRVFGLSSAAMFVWEPVASYMMPWLNGVSIPCMASVYAAPQTRAVITTIFGGISSNEGQGILNFSFDWQNITSKFLSVPLLSQANMWAGLVVSYVMTLSLYHGGAWDSKRYPFMSTSMFDERTGKVWNQTHVFGGQAAILDTSVLRTTGLPRLAATNIWGYMMTMAATGALFSHMFLFHASSIRHFLNQAWLKTETDPHFKAMARYKPVPVWWYLAVLAFGFSCGLGAIIQGHTTLDAWAYVAALLLGCVVTPFSLCLEGLLGISVGTTSLAKMLCGIIQPGKPVANLYFAMFSHEVATLAGAMAKDLKVAQYLKIPWRTMFMMQTYGVLLGVSMNYFIMDSIIQSRRDILLDPLGNQTWSGKKIQGLNTTAVTWALAKYVYGFGPGGYPWIPMSLFAGASVPILQYLVSKRHPTVRGWEVRKLVTPVLFQNAHDTTSGTTSVLWSQIATGLWSQWYMRTRHPAWFARYNYILGGGLDAGAKVMMFILTFTVLGGLGTERNFPNWWGNRQSHPPREYGDYCGM